MKWSNPLHYPLAVLTGGVALVIGARVVSLPMAIALPTSAAIAIGSAQLLGLRQPKFDNSPLAREFQAVQAAATDLASKAEILRQEAGKLLAGSSGQLDLLTEVEYACDRASELPHKIEQMAERLQGANSLLSVEELQRQLTEVQVREQRSTDTAKEQLAQLTASLQRNIELAKHGDDTRQAQIVSLSTLIADSAGALQTLQNRLRTANLEDATQLVELRCIYR